MTTITANPTIAQFQAAAALNGFATALGAGISASFMNPLGAGQNAFAQLATMWAVSLGSAAQPQAAPQATWTANTGPNGRGSIDLGDGYTLDLNENNSEITIKNAATGESTRIWGDPHVEVDGKHAFDFWGTTTFTLDNGTKITINTEQWGGNPDAHVASQLVITKGDQAITVDGISQNQLGDLSISMGQNGRALDAATRDGFVLEENGEGAGWKSGFTGQIATQADLNATKVGAAYGPGSTMPSLDELGDALGGYLTLGILLGASLMLDGGSGTTQAAARANAWRPTA